MGRPMGSKNKESVPVTIPGIPIPKTVTYGQGITVAPAPVRYDAIFGIRNHRTGIWKGQNLWELTRLDNDGKRTVLIDATDRRSIINYVVRQIGKIVVINAPA